MTPPLASLAPAAARWAELALHGLWLGILLTAAVALALRGLPRLGPAARHRVWTLVLAAIVVLPALGTGLAPWLGTALSVTRRSAGRAGSVAPGPNGIEPQRTQRTQRTPARREPLSSGTAKLILPAAEQSSARREQSSVSSVSSVVQNGPGALSPAEPPSRRAAEPPRFPMRPVLAIGAGPWVGALFAAWVTVVLVSLARLTAAMRAVRRLAHTGRPLPDALRARIESLLAGGAERHLAALRTSRAVRSPVTVGARRAIVLLPDPLVYALDDELLRDVLLHELAHVERRDARAALWQRVCEALLCHHPGVWWIGRRLRIERELACDAAVVERTGAPRRYARSLVRLAELTAGGTGAPALAAGAAAHALSRRVECLVAATPSRRRASLTTLAAAAAVFALGLASPAVSVSDRGSSRQGRTALNAEDAEERRGLPAAGRLLPPVTASALLLQCEELPPSRCPLRSSASSAFHAVDPGATEHGSVGFARGPIGARIDETLARYEARGFSGVVLVAKDGEVVLHKGYGLADRERRLPMTAGTYFSTAGMVKALTAAAVLTLEAEGRLRVDDPVSRYLGAFPGGKGAATLHHLLTHTDGLARAGADVARARRDDFVAAMKETPSAFAPGEAFRYTDVGHSLLGVVVERVSGEPYERFVRARLLVPAGMTHSRFEGEALPRGAVVAREYAGPPDEQRRVAPRAYRWGRRASLGLVTTAADLYRLLVAMHTDAVLPERVRRRMLTPYVATGYRTLQGYGWDLQRVNGARVERRLAGTPGFEGELLHNADEGWDAVILVNTQVGWRYAVWDEISAAARGAPSSPLDAVLARLRYAPYLGGRPIPVRTVASIAP